LRVGGAIGATGDYLERAEALLAEEVDCLLLDVAHADSDVVERAIQAFRRTFKEVPLVVGNVATAPAARWLADLGADAVKVGVGPGRGCRTRLETGGGAPQLRAGRVPYVGSVVAILARVRGHLQSAVSYAGERDLLSAHRKISRDPGRFLIPLSEAARRESFVR